LKSKIPISTLVLINCTTEHQWRTNSFFREIFYLSRINGCLSLFCSWINHSGIGIPASGRRMTLCVHSMISWSDVCVRQSSQIKNLSSKTSPMWCSLRWNLLLHISHVFLRIISLPLSWKLSLRYSFAFFSPSFTFTQTCNNITYLYAFLHNDIYYIIHITIIR